MSCLVMSAGVAYENIMRGYFNLLSGFVVMRFGMVSVYQLSEVGLRG